MDQFEEELKQALERRPAPPSMKRKLMQRRMVQRSQTRRHRTHLWMQMAAGLLLAAVLGGGAEWQMRRMEERRQGEEARRQVLTALRITNHALDKVKEQLAEHGRGTGD